VSDAIQTLESPKTTERRVRPRQQVSFSNRFSFSAVQLEHDNGGVILNISERGLAMRVVGSVADDPFLLMRFQIAQSNNWVETKARIVWLEASKATAGVEFIDLPYEGRIRIRRWISSIVQSEAAANVGHVVEDQNQTAINRDPIVVLPSAAETPVAERVSESSAPETEAPAATENAGRRKASPVALSYGKQYSREIESRERTIDVRKSGRQNWIWVLSALLLSTLMIFVAFHMRMIASNRHARELAVVAKRPALLANSSANPPKASVSPDLPWDRAGFVLQVGAMTHEDNADRLAESLRKRNFPAFVFQRGTDRFFRVVVGPYPDADSTSKVKEELRKQDLDAIRVQWNP
jgi:cell division septation protein DedD